MHTPVGCVALVWPELPISAINVAQAHGLASLFCTHDGLGYIALILFAIFSIS